MFVAGDLGRKDKHGRSESAAAERRTRSGRV